MKKISWIVFFLFLEITFLNAQCNNVNFESSSVGTYTNANAVTGWTISSQTNTGCATNTIWAPGSAEFSIVSTPLLGLVGIGTLPNSPFGGTKVARLNNSVANNSVTRLSQTFSVSSSMFYQVAFAALLEAGTHSCCEQSSFLIQLKDPLGTVVSCETLSLSANVFCPNANVNFSITGSYNWLNWQTHYVDLTSYTGSLVTIEVVAKDCSNGTHICTLYFDATCGIFGGGPFPIPMNFASAYCLGSTAATIQGPLGFTSYSWQAPVQYSSNPILQTNLASITVTNPIAGTVFTVTCYKPNGCFVFGTATLTPSLISIAGIGSSPSCFGGASGSGTVQGSGNYAGYNYTWANSTNSVVGTGPVVTGLSPGSYTVTLSAIGNTMCGTVSSSISVTSPTSNSIIELLKPYCGPEAYLAASPGAGFQWYSGLSPIAGSLGGTAPGYTVTNPVHLAVYWLSYTTFQGCNDSIKFTLVALPPGSVSITNISLICPGGNNGTALINMTPAGGSPPGINSYSVFSTGTTSPYSASLNPTGALSYSAVGLSAGTYSVKAFDGICRYSTNFTVSPFIYDFTVSPASFSLCEGNALGASVTFTSPPFQAQYSYSWSPNIFLAGNANTYSSTIIIPTISIGSQTTLIYTVLVTPSIVNCPIAKSISITVGNPITPTIFPIPNFCPESPTYTISALPVGGIFSALTGLSSNGVLSPGSVNWGLRTIIYSKPIGVCIASTSAGFEVYPRPTILVSGNNYICVGGTATLTASGANTYTWNTSAVSNSIAVSPPITTWYGVVGTSSNGCVSPAATPITVYVANIPTLSVSNPTVCTNQNATVVASGAITYTWNNGVISPSLILNYSQAGTYTVTGTNYGSCISSKTVFVNSGINPTITLPSNINFCSGNTLTITAGGGNTYSWNTGSSTASITISPLVSTTYVVSGTNLSGCTAQASLVANVIPSPNLSVLGQTHLCLGETSTLTANGAHNYRWDEIFGGPVLVVSPTITTSYVLLGSFSNSCFNFKIVTVNVSPCTSLDESFSAEIFKLFPNPTSGKFTIENSAASHFILYDQLGKIVLEREIQEGTQEFNVGELASGIYFIVLSNSAGSTSFKLLKSDL